MQAFQRELIYEGIFSLLVFQMVIYELAFNRIYLLPAATKLWPRLYFYTCLSFILFTGGEGVCLSACWDTTPPPGADPPWSRPPQSRHPPGADTPLEQTPPHRSRHPPPEQTPQLGSRLQHTVYERPVCILLECILVIYQFAKLYLLCRH